MEVNRYGQPWVSNLAVLFFSVFFCLFTGANWVQYIYAVSCIAAGVVYFMCCMNAMKLRRMYPDWERPYRAPGGDKIFIIGLFISVWIVIGSALELEIGGYISLAIYFLIGYGLHLLMAILRKRDPEKYPVLSTLTPDDKERMGTL
jgi:APA family basic amino acid/polyamine antiporter